MLKKITSSFSVIVSCLAISIAMISGWGCTQHKAASREAATHRPIPVRGNPNTASIHYYLMGETAFIEGNFFLALSMLKQADDADPENVTIKERLLEILFYLAESDSSFNNEMIEMGKRFLAEEVESPTIYRYLGLAYFNADSGEEGLALMKKALNLDSNPYNLYDYFLYLARFSGELEFIYLERALEKAGNDQRLIYAIAQIYEYHNPFRSKEILENTYQKLGDEESFGRLAEFYRRFNDTQSLIDLLEQRLVSGKSISVEDKILLLEYLFYFQNYDRIIELKSYFLYLNRPNVSEFLFMSAYYTDEYDLAIEIAKSLLVSPEFPEEKREMLLGSLGELYALKGEYDIATDYFIRLDDLSLISSALTADYEDKDVNIHSDLVIELLAEKGLDHRKASYLRAKVYQKTGEQDNLAATLQRLVNQDLSFDQDFELMVVILLLEEEMLESAEVVLSKTEREDIEAKSFIGSYYYYSGKEELAQDYLEIAVESHPHPSAETFLTLVSIYEKKGEHRKELALLERALELHPNDAMLLNWYGYSLVVHTERYAEAEILLLKALEIEPDSHFIQDSVAWLYYKLEDYDKALHYMNDIIDSVITDSIVAYHVGMIYYKLGELSEAIEYLNLSIQLNTDSESVEKANEAVNRIKEYYE